jgi:hypothetical protein
MDKDSTAKWLLNFKTEKGELVLHKYNIYKSAYFEIKI